MVNDCRNEFELSLLVCFVLLDYSSPECKVVLDPLLTQYVVILLDLNLFRLNYNFLRNCLYFDFFYLFLFLNHLLLFFFFLFLNLFFFLMVTFLLIRLTLRIAILFLPIGRRQPQTDGVFVAAVAHLVTCGL